MIEKYVVFEQDVDIEDYSRITCIWGPFKTWDTANKFVTEKNKTNTSNFWYGIRTLLKPE